MCWLKWVFVWHSCEQRRLVSLHSLALTLVAVPKSYVLAQMGICVTFMRAAKTGESTHLHRLAWAFSRYQNLTCMLIWWLFCHSCEQHRLVSLHICTVSPEPSSQFQNLMYWLKWVFVCNLKGRSEVRLVWAFVTVTKSHVLAQVAICMPFYMRAAETGEFAHLCRLAWDI